jgi:arylamine N-acetyltransferase
MMDNDPLAPPGDRRVLETFIQRFGLRSDGPPEMLLRDIVMAFAHLPYENLTKIIKEDAEGAPVRARRLPAEVIADHVRLGAGGTCFSLTAALLYILRAAGWDAHPLLADRRYGPNTHCALVVQIEDRPFLLDPGYLILDPIPLDSAHETKIATEFNEVVLSPQPGSERLELSTVSQGQQRYRLTFKTAPVDSAEFLRAWDASFDWDMMRYPVLNRVRGGRQLYLQGNRYQQRERELVEREEVPHDRLVECISADFGVDRSLAARALAILRRRGESHG